MSAGGSRRQVAPWPGTGRGRLIVVRLLGGCGYWPYGVEQLAAVCRERGIGLALLPGDDQPDAELAALSSLPPDARHRLWRYLVEGGIDNAVEFLRFTASLIGHEGVWREPRPLPHAGLYWPDGGVADIAMLRARHWREANAVAPLVFYRALVQAGNLAVIDALIEALATVGLSPLPIYVTSLKDPISAAMLRSLLAEARPDIILNATGFAVATPGAAESAGGPFAACDCPVLQVIFAGCDIGAWRDGTQGLPARDIAMNVALPEVDGRIIARAVSFKGVARRDALTEADIVAYEPEADRIEFTALLAANWARLRRTPPSERRIAIVLANYPNKDGRLGNGVGLDTPASVVGVLRALADAGYAVDGIPQDGNALIERLAAGPTNAVHRLPRRTIVETFPRSSTAISSPRCRTRRNDALPSAGARRRATRYSSPASSTAAASPFPPSAAATWRCACSRRAATTSTRLRAITTRPAAAARLSRLLCVAARRLSNARGRPLRQARQPGVAAGQGAGALRRLLPGGDAGAPAASVSVHRQRSRRGHAGEASHRGGDHRSSDAAADARRELRPDSRAGAAGRRIRRCRRRRSAPAGGSLGRDLR